MTAESFVERTHAHVATPLERERAAACLASYLNEYTGAWFDSFPDRSVPNRFTSNELVAVSMLAVNVDPHAAVWILREGADELADLLADIPDANIWASQAEAAIAPGGAADRLWGRLQQGRWPSEDLPNGLGAVTAGKLLAAKRPALIPVWDQWVNVALQPATGYFWRSMRSAFTDGLFRENLAAVVAIAAPNITSGAPVPTPLRVFDIIAWMRAHGCAASSNPSVHDLSGKPIGAP